MRIASCSITCPLPNGEIGYFHTNLPIPDDVECRWPIVTSTEATIRVNIGPELVQSEERSRPKDFNIIPPVPNTVPDWAEWFTIDDDGWGDFGDTEPIPGSLGVYWYSPGSESAGYFGPPEDWTKCRWHFEDGKWVQK